MYAIDFEYDGQYLSDYNFIVCKFDYSEGTETISAGSKITFNKTARYGGKQFSLTSTKYEECVQTTFDICKNPDLFDAEDRIITQDEYKDLMRWLNRREYLKFQFLYDEDNYDACFFNASFNIEQIRIGDRLCGLRLTMETDRPFGYGEKQSITLNFSNAQTPLTVYDISDDIGYIYPNLTITLLSSGNLALYNDDENSRMIIKNCSEGEVIDVCGAAHVVSSCYPLHDIANDFNYEFLRIGNTINRRSNKIYASIPCSVTLQYSPIIKAIF